MTCRRVPPVACAHPPESVREGPRVPLRYGSSATEVCSLCGFYRLTFRDTCWWQPGPVPEWDKDEDTYL